MTVGDIEVLVDVLVTVIVGGFIVLNIVLITGESETVVVVLSVQEDSIKILVLVVSLVIVTETVGVTLIVLRLVDVVVTVLVETLVVETVIVATFTPGAPSFPVVICKKLCDTYININNTTH